jgi:PBP1b-binding outer membrane lipoprotein LpoB
MKILFLVLLSTFILAGCASTGAKPSQVERITPEELAKLIPPPVATVSLDEVVADSKAGKSSDDIIAKIKNSNSRYELTSTQVLDLNKRGVDAKVLDYIQQSNELAKQNIIADEMNKREQEKMAAKKQLQRERTYNNNRYYDPYWGSSFGGYYGRGFYPIPIGPAGRHWRGSRFGWGLGFGHPYGW